MQLYQIKSSPHNLTSNISVLHQIIVTKKSNCEAIWKGEAAKRLREVRQNFSIKLSLLRRSAGSRIFNSPLANLLIAALTIAIAVAIVFRNIEPKASFQSQQHRFSNTRLQNLCWEQDSNLRSPFGRRFYRPLQLTTLPSQLAGIWAESGIRTHDLSFTKRLLYRWAISASCPILPQI